MQHICGTCIVWTDLKAVCQEIHPAPESTDFHENEQKGATFLDDLVNFQPKLMVLVQKSLKFCQS